jgi:hypothetical protein
MARKRALLGWAVPVATSVFVGMTCSQTPARPAGNNRIKPSYNEKTGQLERITYDRNGDGKIDATTLMSGSAVVRAELDENYDGVTDRWEYYVKSSTAGNATSRVLEKVESTARPDGKITRWEMYEGGLRRAVEEDTDSDGRVDKWETWEAGVLRAVAVDTQGRGKPDRRFVYPPDGEAPRLEIEESGTGTFTPVTHTP